MTDVIDEAVAEVTRKAKAEKRYAQLCETLKKCVQAQRVLSKKMNEVHETGLRAHGAKLALEEAFGFEEGEDDNAVDTGNGEGAQDSGAEAQAAGSGEGESPVEAVPEETA